MNKDAFKIQLFFQKKRRQKMKETLLSSLSYPYLWYIDTINLKLKHFRKKKSKMGLR